MKYFVRISLIAFLIVVLILLSSSQVDFVYTGF
jgi:hypothetical protein